MPSAHIHTDDDPVIASYDVFVTNPLSQATDVLPEQQHTSRVFVLQYPSHRKSNQPYNAESRQKPTRLRLKPKTGMIEVDVPIFTEQNFNIQAGERYGRALGESRISQTQGSHGLGGGFVSGPSIPVFTSINDLPEHGKRINRILDTQTLGGKMVAPTERDPIYMLGSFKNDELHLTPLDSLVQMRPQLHHIDAEEELSTSSAKSKPGFEPASAKLESKAIEIKMKDNKEDPKDRNLNANAKLLRDIQADQWESHEWVDEADEEATEKADTYTALSSDSIRSKQLRSMLYNDEWLDKMSVPREDGKKGLRSKIKGRERERARRKKVELERQQMNVDGAVAEARTAIVSDSESSLSEHSDVEMVDRSAGLGEADIKQESGSLAAAPAVQPAVPDPVPAESVPRRRGRPKKN